MTDVDYRYNRLLQQSAVVYVCQLKHTLVSEQRWEAEHVGRKKPFRLVSGYALRH